MECDILNTLGTHLILSRELRICFVMHTHWMPLSEWLYPMEEGMSYFYAMGFHSVRNDNEKRL